MSLFAIGDLHLSLNSDKSMEVFRGWERYTERIEKNWIETVREEDTVVVCGDLSWGMSLEESLEDFKFLHKLPGKKIVLKGNHDYWWTTMNKMNAFLEENSLTSISFLHNNAFLVDGISIFGTRGWVNEDSSDFKQSDKKVILREAGRLEASLKAAKELGGEPVAFLHYPPLYNAGRSEEILEILHKNEVAKCYFGHIHSTASQFAPQGIYHGVDYSLVSADYLSFKPKKVI